MKTSIKVGNRTLELANNALTPVLYRQIFGEDFLLLFSQIMTRNRSVIDKALKLQSVKADFDSEKITREDFLAKVTDLGFTDEELGVVNERSELMSKLAFIMNKQAELSKVEKLLELSKVDYYKFLTDFDINELRSPEVVGALINFWNGNTESGIDSKNA